MVPPYLHVFGEFILLDWRFHDHFLLSTLAKTYLTTRVGNYVIKEKRTLSLTGGAFLYRLFDIVRQQKNPPIRQR